MDYLSDVATLITDLADDEKLTITEDLEFGKIDNWDSLSHIKLISACEKHYHIKFNFDEVMQCKTVGSLIAAIRNKS